MTEQIDRKLQEDVENLLNRLVRFFKDSKEEIKIMCRAMEDMRNQILKEVALRMLAAGKYVLDENVNISGLSFEEVKQLKADRSV